MEAMMEKMMEKMTYKMYLKIMKKTHSDFIEKNYAKMMSRQDDNQNWDLLSFKLNIFQQKLL